MTPTLQKLRSFLDHHEKTALVEVAGAKGSTPREKGAWMLVSRTAIFGTIGGGQLEFMAIDKARALLAGEATDADGAAVFSVPLGPALGQCCGGRVELSIRPVDRVLARQLAGTLKAEEALQPHVYVFGGGHVGHALAAVLALLPVQTMVVETRAEALEDMPAGIMTRLTPVPEEVVASAPAGSAFVVLTHEHSLDFLIVAAALGRGRRSLCRHDRSETKKATFRLVSQDGRRQRGAYASWCRRSRRRGEGQAPAVIAALATAEILKALTAFGAR